LRALGVGTGDEVITTPFSFVASANAALFVGARPVFVDIDPRTLNLDPSHLERALTSRTKAILVVHVFGRPAPMDEILEFSRRHGLAVIEDACEAIGAMYRGKKVGSLGDAGVFAFYPNKQMTTGEGGIVVTAQAPLAHAMRSLRNQGREEGMGENHVELGYNYRLSELQCALGIGQLSRLGDFLERRERLAEAYGRRLRDQTDLVLPEQRIEDGQISWFVYVVRLHADFTQQDRDWIAEQLKAHGIGCGKYFACIHLQPFYRRSFGYKGGDFLRSEEVSARTLALPFFNQLTDAQVDEVCMQLVRFCRERRKIGAMGATQAP
jgi:perosamine synthetase